MLRTLGPGDVTTVTRIDRLARSAFNLFAIVKQIVDAKARFRSLTKPFLYITSDFAQIVFAILGVAAKLERRRILERTARGREDAKAKGVKFSRKPKLTEHQQRETRARVAAGQTQRSIGRSDNVSQATISRLTPTPSRVRFHG